MLFVITLIGHGDGWQHEVAVAANTTDDARAAVATLQQACPAVAWSSVPVTLDADPRDADGVDGDLLARYIVGVERGALAAHAAAGSDGDLVAAPGFVIKVQAVDWPTALALAADHEPDLEPLAALHDPADAQARADVVTAVNERLRHTDSGPGVDRAGLLRAGVSNKYGTVFVERVGRTGFDDVTEPVALLRAQDKHALACLAGYLLALREDPAVPAEQVQSVTRQVMAFARWRAVNGVRTPGAPAR